MVEDRRLNVLRAIVQDYVATREPVGSKMLTERHDLGVSPATIRNDMALLEDEGYITQPHTSAGRIPTDKGYRLFVDRLTSIKPLSPAERRAIETFLDGAVDLDDVVLRTVRLLAQLTHQVAVVQYPMLASSTLRHLELVPLTLGGPGPSRALMILITDTGRVEQRVVDVPAEVDEQVLATLHTRLNAAAVGTGLPDLAQLLRSVPQQLPPELRGPATAVLAAMADALAPARDERIVLAGTANLARFGTDFPATLSPVLDALEEHVVLLRLLGELADPLTVRIGSENSHEGLAAASIVSASYGDGHRNVAKMGVLGPMRMDYPSTMGAVRAVARYVGAILADSQGHSQGHTHSATDPANPPGSLDAVSTLAGSPHNDDPLSEKAME